MAPTASRRSQPWPGYVLGFALGGFFDGILLHQILQWHHLLSAINGGDIRFQVAADGYFHALMYGVAAAGLWMLWRSRGSPAGMSGRSLFAGILIGFGAWHIVDALLSHWLLGIHRIRMDSINRLFWDLLWVGLFGLVPVVFGWILKGPKDGTPQFVRSADPARTLVVLLVLGAGALGIWPLRGNEFATVLFAPGAGQDHAVRSLASAGAQLVWMDASGELAVVRLARGQSGWWLFRHGAILVTGAGLPAGCLNFLRT
ncbi:putative membrane protein [Microvirga lupini]|uniref:Putative membrane protein n=1 Tax=Microvirga lupini TaxID=420324 RepID=A0A7W4VLC8_9HYPH|nr:putative membrane protein [Microvirga lupini]